MELKHSEKHVRDVSIDKYFEDNKNIRVAAALITSVLL